MRTVAQWIWSWTLLLTYACFSSGRVFHDVNQIFYNFTTCGSQGRLGPSFNQCSQYYQSVGSPISGNLLEFEMNGYQLFKIPRTGDYTFTIAGARGGYGICSPYTGLGAVIQSVPIRFIEGDVLRILVGHEGLSPCDNSSHPLCSFMINTDIVLDNCTAYWNFVYAVDDTIYFHEGGGGGGGASMVVNHNTNMFIAISPGGGGSSALYNGSAEEPNVFELLSDGFTDLQGFGESGNRVDSSAFISGVGAGLRHDPENYLPIDGFPLDAASNAGTGGMDCTTVNGLAENFSFPFLETDGGFGGGGGGCVEGGGGGGYTGGDVRGVGEYQFGEGGFGFPTLSTIDRLHQIGTNDGHGYVSLLFTSCGCTHDCSFNETVFHCSCNDNSTLAPDGFDCYTEDELSSLRQLQTVHETTTSYGEVSVTYYQLDAPYHVYSISASFNTSRSDLQMLPNISQQCGLLLVNRSGMATAVSEFLEISGSSDNSQLLKLHVVSGSINDQSLGIEEPVEFLQSPVDTVYILVVSAGIECRLSRVSINMSLLQGENILNTFLGSRRDLSVYLNTISSLVKTTIVDSTGQPQDNNSNGSSKAVGIVAGCIALVIIVILGVAVFIVCKRSIQRQPLPKSYSIRKSYSVKDANQIDAHRIEAIYTKYEDNIIVNQMRLSDESEVHEYDELVFGTEDGMAEPENFRAFDTVCGIRAPDCDYVHYNLSRKSAAIDQEQWTYSRDQLIYLRELGEGQFGKVLLMNAKGGICGYDNDVPVAVKTLSSRNIDDLKKFKEEAQLMVTFCHSNIVSLLGYCESNDKDEAPLMILEYMQYGDLKDFLFSHKPDNDGHTLITEGTMFSFAENVVSALNFLSSQKYVHRDIAARNCLVGASLKVKVADFGLARGVHDKDYYRVKACTLLPVRWMAPESLLYGRFTSATDVWSYGVLLWEIASFAVDVPYSEVKNKDVVEVISSGRIVLERPADCPSPLFELMTQCQQFNPEDRPDFSTLLEKCTECLSTCST